MGEREATYRRRPPDDDKRICYKCWTGLPRERFLWCRLCSRMTCEDCHEKLPIRTRYMRFRWNYAPGTVDRLDNLIQRIMFEYKLPEETHIFLNWYPRGHCVVEPHRHDNWTALCSFGSSRILTVDYQRCMMEDGDFVLFGTQKHSVPPMESVLSGRISLVMMFAPTDYHRKSAWCSTADLKETDLTSRRILQTNFGIVKNWAKDWFSSATSVRVGFWRKTHVHIPNVM